VVGMSTSTTLLWTAIALVLASVALTLIFTASLGRSLKMLGRVTFIPGFLGLVFTIFGRDIVLLYLASTVPAFVKIQQAVTFYLDTAVPKVRYLTFGFFMLGALLWLLGDKMEAELAVSKIKTALHHV